MKAFTVLCFTVSAQALWAFASGLSTSITSLQGTSFVSTTNISALPPRTTTLTSQKPSDLISHSASNFTLPPSTTLSAESSTLTFSKTPSITATTGTSLTTTPTTSQPTQTIEPAALGEIETIHERRLSAIIGVLTDASSISAWLTSLGTNGKWPDSEVDYTTGCDARRANWPAQEHWKRLVTMSSAWHGGLAGADQFVKNEALRTSISHAMDYWFSRDLTNIACLDSGGTEACPCSNTDDSLWFVVLTKFGVLLTMIYLLKKEHQLVFECKSPPVSYINLSDNPLESKIILIPDLVGQTCLLLNETLTPGQFLHCTNITGRSFGTFDHNINGVGFLTGANTLDVAAIGIDQALLTVNVSMLTDAYRRIHLEMAIANTVMADGIRADGAFGQHNGILYNGNYGKDFINDILDIEVEAGGTQFAANTASQTAFATLFDGNRWMIYRNAVTGILHWDFSALGRFISFPVIDNQATGSIKINLTRVNELGKQWSSSSLIEFASSLLKKTSNANAGQLKGNRMFYTNDYMVHRGSNYISTVKMFSSRTQNTECVNTQNPMGFHLSDGALHTYLHGNEYEDISVAWDWDLIPGITVNYRGTPLSCDSTQFTGIEDFVGGVSDEHVGLAVMRYTNPLTGSLSWQKVWFFLEDDIQHIMVANISSSNNATIYSVLDQRRHAGAIILDGRERLSQSQTVPQSLWHGGVGYTFPATGNTTVSLRVGEMTGSWATIGTSTQPPATVDLFAAWIEHESPDAAVSYTAFPGTTLGEFSKKNRRLLLLSIQNDAHVSAVYDKAHKTVMIVFWNRSGGSVTFEPSAKDSSITISVNGNLAVLYKISSGEIVVSDPSQTLLAVEVNLALGNKGEKPPHWGTGHTKALVFALPQGGLAGSSTTQTIE